MRVCIFSTAYLPFVGGAEIALKEITKRLPDWQFDLFTARLDPTLARFETVENMYIYRVGSGALFDKKLLALHGSFYAAERHRQRPYDVVWSMMASYGGFAALALKKKFPRIPFLLTLQEGDTEQHIAERVKGFTWLFKQIFERADALQAISNHLLVWGQRMGFHGRVKTVIPNGVDVHAFGAAQGGASEREHIIRRQFNIPDDARFVITVSRLVEKNGVDTLISAMKYLPSFIHLLIAGEGECMDELKAQAFREQVDIRVHFLGTISRDELPMALRASSVFCRPSVSEGLGNAFLEAMAAGVPVVGTAVGGIPDFLRDGETGLFCSVNNPPDTAEKILRVLNDASLAERLRSNAKKMIEEQFSWDAIALRMKTLFETLV